jgi:hypothetical protein
MCCHPAARFKPDNVTQECIGLEQGSTDWVHWDLSRRVMMISVTGKCGVPGCGTVLTMNSEKTIVQGDWDKCVTTK